MKIKSHNLNKKILLVAEIGNNHEGNFNLAKKLIKVAANSGADAVKFQSFITESNVSKDFNPQRYKMLKKFQLSALQFKKLKKYANELKLIFISTPLDIESANYLKNIVDAYKIASGDINFYPMIEIVSKTKKPLIVSTGVSNLNEIKKTLNFIKRYRSLDNVIVLHCVSNYPTIDEECNLNNIFHLKKIIKNVGYSDHTIGIESALCSISMGVKCIEKHFTINNNYSNFRDHKISSDPTQFKELSNKVRLYEKFLGARKFKTLPDKQSKLIKRSIILKKDLKKGSIIKKNDIAWIRPGTGEKPGSEKIFIGKKIKLNIASGVQLKKYHLEK